MSPEKKKKGQAASWEQPLHQRGQNALQVRRPAPRHRLLHRRNFGLPASSFLSCPFRTGTNFLFIPLSRVQAPQVLPSPPPQPSSVTSDAGPVSGWLRERTRMAPRGKRAGGELGCGQLVRRGAAFASTSAGERVSFVKPVTTWRHGGHSQQSGQTAGRGLGDAPATS